MSERLHGLRHLDLNKTKVLVREFHKLFREGREIIRRGKIVEGCPTKLIGGYYAVFGMMGRKTEPSLKLIRDVKKGTYELTKSGQEIGRLLYEGKYLDAEKRLVSIHIDNIPQLAAFLGFMAKRPKGVQKGKRVKSKSGKSTTKHPIPRINGELLDIIIKEQLLATGKWRDVTCNIQTVDQCIDFCMQIKCLQMKDNKYILDRQKVLQYHPFLPTELLTPESIVDSIFNECRNISEGRSVFIPISELRSRICKRHKITETLFDKILVLLWKSNKGIIEFGTGPSDLLGRPLLGDRRKAVVLILKKPFVPKIQIQKLLSGEGCGES